MDTPPPFARPRRFSAAVCFMLIPQLWAVYSAGADATKLDVPAIFAEAGTPAFYLTADGAPVRVPPVSPEPSAHPPSANSAEPAVDSSLGTVRIQPTTDGTFQVFLRERLILTTATGDIFCPLYFDPTRNSLYAITDLGQKFAAVQEISADGHTRVVSIDPQQRVDCAGVVATTSTPPQLAAAYFIDDRIRYDFLLPELAELHRLAVTLLPDADILWLQGSADGRVWLAKILRYDQPAGWYRFIVGKTEPEILYAPSPVSHPARTEPFRYAARDGMEVHGYLTLPPGSTGKNLPTVVFPHGGPELRVYRWFDPRVQILAQAGYAVFRPNYRGSRGFGKSYRQTGWRQWGTGMQQNNITDGVRELIKRGVSDPQRFAIFGGSFGGYCAVAGMAFTPELYRCGISLFGFFDIEAYLTDSQADPLAGFDRVICGDLRLPGELERLKAASPLNFAGRIERPVFLYHGAQDSVISVRQTDRLAEKLRQEGKVFEYYRNPLGEHGFSDSQTESAIYEGILRFLARYLKDQDFPITPEAAQRLKALAGD